MNRFYLKLYFVLIITLITLPSKLFSITADQVKTFATSVATSALGEVLPPPVSLANDLVTNAPELLKANVYAYLIKTLTDLESSYDEDKLKGTPLKLFKHKKAKLAAMRSALMNQDPTALNEVLLEGEKLRKEIKEAKEKRKREKEKKRKEEIKEDKETDLYMLDLYYSNPNC